MPRKTLYILSGIAALGFAIGLLFMPETFWGLYGGEVDLMGAWVSRIMTATMFANVFLFWTLKDAPSTSKEAKLFSQSQIIAWGLMAVIVVLATLSVGLNTMAWGAAGLGAIFTVLFAIDGFKS